ncbi:MAG: hypothetical protein QJQ54_00415 [Mollicutes bacterium]|nr:MAG: hypothetical protein QJQ54_00415 [Mollicutes bacterium]
MEELEEKIQNVEKNIQNTVSHSIKSIGYISIVISLGLTAIVSFVGLAMNKASFE